jgi:transcriptional regulator with XRE-family HTH domain
MVNGVLFMIFGLGKRRTKFGRFIDKEEIKQIELEELTGLSRGTISKICNDKKYRPKFETVMKIKKALKQLGKSVPEDYFGM